MGEVEKALDALDRLLKPDASYHGSEIRLPADNHGDAIRRISDARDAVQTLRAALEPQP